MQDAEVDAKSVNHVYSYSCSSYREFPLALANLLVPVSCLATLITLPGDLKGDSSKTSDTVDENVVENISHAFPSVTTMFHHRQQVVPGHCQLSFLEYCRLFSRHQILTAPHRVVCSCSSCPCPVQAEASPGSWGACTLPTWSDRQKQLQPIWPDLSHSKESTKHCHSLIWVIWLCHSGKVGAGNIREKCVKVLIAAFTNCPWLSSQFFSVFCDHDYIVVTATQTDHLHLTTFTRYIGCNVV